MVLKIGQPSPDFQVDSYSQGEDKPQKISISAFKGKWVVLFFYPRDFTFVCPTEIERFSSLSSEFAKENAEIIGASTDSFFCHKAWYETDERLKEVKFPIISDTNLNVSRLYEVLDEASGTAFRGTFIIDPNGILHHITINNMDTGRSVDETLRTLQALKTGALCPAEWRPGQKTL